MKMSAAMWRTRRPRGNTADSTDVRQGAHYAAGGIFIELLIQSKPNITNYGY